MRYEQRTKGVPTSTIIGLIFVSIIYLLLIYTGVERQKIELRDTIRREGVVRSVGVHTLPRQRYEWLFGSAQILYIQLSGVNTKLEVFRRWGGYDDLLENIQVGDRIVVHFMSYRRTDNDKNRGIRLIHITKGGEIVLDKSVYQRQQRILIYVGLLGLLSNVVIYIQALRKGRKEDEGGILDMLQ